MDVEMKQMYHDTLKSGDHHIDVRVVGDEQDQEDMARMGRKTDLKRIFRQSSMVAFTCIVQATWQVFLVANTQGLVNGGLAGVFWSYVWTSIGMSTVVASLAEMASMQVVPAWLNSWTTDTSQGAHQWRTIPL
ncbi:hypothetical protein B0A55_04886, partial [Friedmanniomyces simplex]